MAIRDVTISVDDEHHVGRLSGPLRDRLDLIVEVQAVPVRTLTEGVPGEASASVRARVLAAREWQLTRNVGRHGARLLNMGLTGRELKAHASLDAEGRRLLDEALQYRFVEQMPS